MSSSPCLSDIVGLFTKWSTGGGRFTGSAVSGGVTNDVLGLSVSKSGVVKAPNMDCNDSGFNLLTAVDAFVGSWLSSTTAKFSFVTDLSACDAYSNNPIIPNTMINVVPGFMVS